MNSFIKTLRNKLNLGIGLLIAGVPLAHAHPGHDFRSESLSHTLTSPYHLLLLTLGGIALVWGAALVQRMVARRALQFLGAGAIATATILSAIQLLG